MYKLDKVLNLEFLQTCDENKFYTYLHLTEDELKVFYVGKGHKDRCCNRTGRGNWWYNVVNKHGFVVIIDQINLTEQEAFDREKELISIYGRKQHGGILINLTDGGEGVSGRIYTQEERKKISERIKSDLEKFQSFGERNKYFGKQLFGEDNPNYGNKGANNPNSKKVIKYSLEGVQLKEYDSLTLAAEDNNTNISAISAVCKRKRNQLKGFVYRYKGDSASDINLDKTHRKAVFQLDKTTLEIIKEYESATAAAKENGFNATNISQVCRGEKKTHKGFVWIYKKDYNKN